MPQFFLGIVDDPGEAGDAESYKTALELGLKRSNNVGACTDNPSVMVKARNLIRQDPMYSTQVLVPCSWHATDLVVPVRGSEEFQSRHQRREANCHVLQV